MRILFLAAAILLLSGCDFFGPDESLNDVIAPADSIRFVSVQDRAITINVYSRCSDPCWLYSRSTETHTDNEITMKFYKVRKEQSVCPQVITWLTIPVNITVATAGKYTLKFYRSESSSLDTTVTL